MSDLKIFSSDISVSGKRVIVRLDLNVPINNSNALKKGLENNPKCLLIMKKNEKISRNEKCPATGKKYKHCCGAL